MKHPAGTSTIGTPSKLRSTGVQSTLVCGRYANNVAVALGVGVGVFVGVDVGVGVFVGVDVDVGVSVYASIVSNLTAVA